MQRMGTISCWGSGRGSRSAARPRDIPDNPFPTFWRTRQAPPFAGNRRGVRPVGRVPEVRVGQDRGTNRKAGNRAPASGRLQWRPGGRRAHWAAEARYEQRTSKVRGCIGPGQRRARAVRGAHGFSAGGRLAVRVELERPTLAIIWYSKASGVSPLQWMQNTFVEIKNGRRPDIALPRLIDVMISDDVLGEAIFGLNLVDTKGVDQTVVRPDLEARLHDPRTLTVLCTRFNEAPGPTMQRFLEHARDTLPEGIFKERVLLLVLPRPDEARAVKDDTGEMVESDDEGYEFKRDQAEATLRRIGVGELPITFFNATTDAPDGLKDCLVNRIGEIRSGYSRRIRSVCDAIDRMIENHEVEAVQAAQKEVRKRLRIFCDQHKALPNRRRSLHVELVKAFRTLNARTVWATTRRRGGWYNLDVFFHLGRGGAADANLRSRSALLGLEELVSNMLGDDDYGSMHEFLYELQENVEDWRRNFIERARAVGEETFRSSLADDAQFWARCEHRWGQGGGYRDDVANMVEEWFESSEREPLHSSAETKIRAAWRKHVIKPLGRLIN